MRLVSVLCIPTAQWARSAPRGSDDEQVEGGRTLVLCRELLLDAVEVVESICTSPSLSARLRAECRASERTADVERAERGLLLLLGALLRGRGLGRSGRGLGRRLASWLRSRVRSRLRGWSRQGGIGGSRPGRSTGRVRRLCHGVN